MPHATLAPALRWPAEAVWQAAEPLLSGFSVEILPELGSTNTELMRRARLGRADPVLLVAERQTAGRGRLGRAWSSHGAALQDGAGFDAGAAARAASVGPANGVVDSGATDTAAADKAAIYKAATAGPDAATQAAQTTASLTFSLGLALSPADWSGLSLAVGLAVAHSLHPGVQIKWPNDLWFDGRKLGGILIETVAVGELRYAVIGIGINIERPVAQDLRTPPAALRELLPEVDAAQALGLIALPLVQAVLRFAHEGFGPLRSAYHARDLLYGQELVCTDGTVGQGRGVDASGALLLHTASGLQKISSAEVSVRPKSPVFAGH
jgi:BirA family biotin operon repressor/biotin-[acetyl-CoA-carboxylase] ligase